MATYAKIVTFGPVIIASIVLLGIAVGSLLQRAHRAYPKVG